MAILFIGSVGFSVEPGENEHWGLLHRSEADFTVIQLWTRVMGNAGAEYTIVDLMALFVVGNALNAKFSWLYVPVIALIAAATGLIWLAIGTGATMFGLSSTVYGLMGAFLVFYPLNKIWVVYIYPRGWLFRYYTVEGFQLAAVWLMLVYAGLDVLFWSIGNRSSTNYPTHLSGFVFGIVLATGTTVAGLTPSRGKERNIFDVVLGRRKRKKADAPVPPRKRGRLLEKYGHGARPRAPRVVAPPPQVDRPPADPPSPA